MEEIQFYKKYNNSMSNVVNMIFATLTLTVARFP